ncbi:LysR family transcriptional regulator [Terriglobus sp. RCC_193]|uniref:LysR family transcriptional regulator n=1 Tax=Terriglobus sp. RCC_193 TaxID=3239218 RepID=UPI0035243409
MVLPDIGLLQAAIVLAEELHFGRAADRLNMSQPTLSKQIFRLERSIGLHLFEHNHQAAELTPAGQVFIAEAREVVFHAERAVLSARAVVDGSTEILNLGKSSYMDPFLVSLVTSVHLPLFPALKIKVWSNYSNVLAQQVIAGTLDVALITGVPPKSKLSTMEITRNPYYVAMLKGDELAAYQQLHLSHAQGRIWMLLGPHVNSYLYDQLQSVAAEKEIHPSDIYHFTSPEEASELVREHRGVAFLPKTAAWRIARDGLTIRPLAEDRLRLITSLAVRADSKSKLVGEFVKAAGRKLNEVMQRGQSKLPLTG